MKNYVGLFFTGIGIGIFLGLSESPILLQILIPILTVIAGLLSILSGQKFNENSNEAGTNTLLNKNISPFPIMWLILGMVGGAYMGLFAKNHDITGFGNKSRYNQRLKIDSLSAELNLIKIKSEILILEKEYQYMSNIKIKNSEQIASYDQFAALAKSFENQRNKNAETNYSSSYEINTFLKNAESDGSNQPIHFCKLYNLCDRKASELVEVLSKSNNEEIKDLLKNYSNNPDTLKSKINKRCNCK